LEQYSDHIFFRNFLYELVGKWHYTLFIFNPFISDNLWKIRPVFTHENPALPAHADLPLMEMQGIPLDLRFLLPNSNKRADFLPRHIKKNQSTPNPAGKNLVIVPFFTDSGTFPEYQIATENEIV
jgi:hypothetical protein